MVHKIGIRFIILFVCLFSLTVPLNYYYLPDLGYYTSPLFKGVIKWFVNSVFGLQEPYTVELLSDSTGMYIHALIIAVISLIIAIPWTWLGKGENDFHKLWYFFKVFASYYLALQLFRYGFDKIFKTQFYLPEPNTLYTPLGYLSKDILYWSTIGSSYPYSAFAGIIEVIPAILLLFRRTRVIGAMIAFGVMVNVVMINFGFDISVKLFSLFLLFISFILAFSGFWYLYQLFVVRQAVQVPEWSPPLDSSKKKITYIAIKTVAIALILFEGFFIYYKAGNYNDDKAARPYLHGAYEVIASSQASHIKRVFIHRRGYFIFQFANDEMQDFKLYYNLVDNRLNLQDYDDTTLTFDFAYSDADSTLTLVGEINGKMTELKAQKLNWKALPLMQKDFHWTIDGYLDY